MGFRDLQALQRRYEGEAGRLLTAFYLPVISRAVRYDRQTGFFDSAALVQLAAGLAAFIRRTVAARQSGEARGTPMRLITGASWSEDDVRAFQRGHEELRHRLGVSLANHFEPSDDECRRLGLPPGWRPEEDQIARHRLGALAWMVARGLLEVRIALPLDHLGRPYQPGRHGALFHPKAGILYDDQGEVVTFQGSVNETGAAWARNREKFEVKRSWYSAQDAEDVRAEIDDFERIWANRDPGLLVLPLPSAVERRLLTFEPAEPPSVDPLEEVGTAAVLADRLAAQFLLDAPRLPGGEALVLGPLALRPYPHQRRVAGRVVQMFPRSFLFCDEVGLGKTIEAGLALRALLLQGRVRRVLVVVPRGLVRQWQEELREKFAVTAWFYDGQRLVDVGGRARLPETTPWEEDGIVLASRHYVARLSRQPELLGVGRPWDLVVVDEAHAARRRVFDADEPNLFLSLLQELDRRRRFRSLWLLTATPMQLDPVEVHDLLRLCGLVNPPWSDWTLAARFEGYFQSLHLFPDQRAVRGEVLRLARMAVDQGAPPLDPARPPAGWDAFRWRGFADDVNQDRPGLALRLDRLSADEAQALTPYLARQTPLAVHMFRHTRATLRAYREHGVLMSPVPSREPADVAIVFATAIERTLYDRIDKLCSRFYRLADLPPGERAGVGFLVAVFRKRLASSFAAFRKTLERRRDLLVQAQEVEVDERLRAELRREQAEDADDVEEGGVDDLVEQERGRIRRLRRERREAELAYLRDYVGALDQIDRDSKFDEFRTQLEELLAAGRRVIVFTQYLDTLDFIREHLVARFADRLVCYSGRGGEVWDPIANGWRFVDKAEIKARSRRDHSRPAQILLATDAASEGLNLQEFSALINYDLPWNPMRIEQRIGRIDRIGQEAPKVRIVNLYLQGSIEQETYAVLRQRIGFFEDVVGPLQPILAEVPRILRAVALGELEREAAHRELEYLAHRDPASPIRHLEWYVQEEAGESAQVGVLIPPATQRQLAEWCLQHPASGMRLAAIPEPGMAIGESDAIAGCFRLTWSSAPSHLGIGPDDAVVVTFNPVVADRHPPTAIEADEGEADQRSAEGVRLLTWGDPLLEAWIEAIRGDSLTDQELTRVEFQRVVDPIRYRRLNGAEGQSVTFSQVQSVAR